MRLAHRDLVEETGRRWADHHLVISRHNLTESCSVLQGPPGAPGHPGPRGLPGEKVSLTDIACVLQGWMEK